MKYSECLVVFRTFSSHVRVPSVSENLNDRGNYHSQLSSSSSSLVFANSVGTAGVTEVLVEEIATSEDAVAGETMIEVELAP